MITIPDFEVMAQNLVIRHCCSMQPIEIGIAEELKAMFDQGYVLGRREEAETDDWFSAQDVDELWQVEFGASICSEDRAVLAELAYQEEFGVTEQILEDFRKRNAKNVIKPPIEE